MHVLGITLYLVGAPLSSEPFKASCRSLKDRVTSQTLWTSMIGRMVLPYRIKFPIRVYCQQGFTSCFVYFLLLSVFTVGRLQNTT
jgi:hypothetical protein